MSKTINTFRYKEVTNTILVDDEDFDACMEYTWHQDVSGAAHAYYVKDDGAKSTLWMHRFIAIRAGMLSTEIKNMDVTHINGNRLDNRRENLYVDRSYKNRVNERGDGSSRFRGVLWVEERQCWNARYYIDGVCHNLGYYRREEDAGLAAEQMRADTDPLGRSFPCQELPRPLSMKEEDDMKRMMFYMQIKDLIDEGVPSAVIKEKLGLSRSAFFKRTKKMRELGILEDDWKKNRPRVYEKV